MTPSRRRTRVGGESVHVRLSRAQTRFLEAAADYAGVSFSEALRLAVTDVMSRNPAQGPDEGPDPEWIGPLMNLANEPDDTRT